MAKLLEKHQNEVETIISLAVVVFYHEISK